MNRNVLLVGRVHQADTEPDAASLLEESLETLAVTQIASGVDALALLDDKPQEYTVVVVDTASAGLPAAAMVQGIHQISPLVEVVLVCPAQTSWQSLGLLSTQRPILLNRPMSRAALLSCVAKLLELAESRREHERLRKNFKTHAFFSRKNIEAILALLYRPVGVGMISTRRDGFITFFNPGARQLTGYGQDELPHIRKWVDTLLADPAETPYTLSRFEKAWSKGANREEFVMRIRHKDGRIMRLSVSFLVLQDDSGEPRQLVALLFDPKNWTEAQACKGLLESSHLAYYSYHRNNGFEIVTPAALELINRAFSLQLEMDQVQGKLIGDLPLPQDMGALWKKWLDDFPDQGPGRRTMPPPLGLPGRRVLEHFHATARTAEEGGDVGVVAVLRAREDLVAESRQHAGLDDLYRATLMNLPHPFVLLKAIRDETERIIDFTCIGFNRAALSLLKRQELLDSHLMLQEVFPPGETLDIIMGYAVESAETGSEHTYETLIRLRPKDKAESMVQFWIGKVGDGAALFFRDTTAKREQEKALKQYRHIFAHMEESIVVTDLEGIVTDWNPASERMYGYRKREIIGKPAHLLTSDMTGSPLQQEAMDILRDGEVWKSEYRFTRRDEHPGMADTVFAVLKDDSGHPYGTVGLSHDVTEDKKIKERLKVRTQELQEKNVALNTLLRHAEAERLRACEQVASDVTAKITDGLTKIMGAKSNPALVENLSRLLLHDLGQSGPAGGHQEHELLDTLTEKELEVARLIRMGKTTEDIAFILGKSPDTVRLQRISIRKKLGLTRRDHNLREALNRLEMF